MAKFDDDLTEINYKGANLFKSPTMGNCWHCGDLTYWIDINLEVHICSEECEDAEWGEYSKALGERNMI